MSDIGFFIWCHNDQQWLSNCLATFKASTDAYLVGIDNGSTDNSRGLLEGSCDFVLWWDENASMSQCVNTGYDCLYKAGFKYLGWIHPDMKFPQIGWTTILKDTLDRYSRIGKVSIWNAKYGSPPVRAIIAGAEAGNLIRRESWDEIGPYDTAYIGCGGYEDWDIQRRFIAKGLANCINTDARAYHEHVGTRIKIPHDIRHEMWMLNQGVYFNKWKTYDNAMVPDGFEDIPLIG